jgi:hypothetical protein
MIKSCGNLYCRLKSFRSTQGAASFLFQMQILKIKCPQIYDPEGIVMCNVAFLSLYHTGWRAR